MLTLLPIRYVADVEATRNFYEGVGLTFQPEASTMSGPSWVRAQAHSASTTRPTPRGGRPARSNSGSRLTSGWRTLPPGWRKRATHMSSSRRTSGAASASPTRTG
jgi:hypothetical protein